MPSPLPPFADQWVQQWKDAAPRLQAIRDEELRRRALEPSSLTGERRESDRDPLRHGMVIMQRWFMRRQLIALTRKCNSDQGMN